MAMLNWITVDPDGGAGRISVSVEATGNVNASGSSRSGTMTVKTASGLTKTVSLSQAGRKPINVIVGSSEGYLTKLSI